tara:strand:- start:59 stop:442 length:384 start_codon:yes stop_codon:yes gene_type:complete
MSIEKRIFEVLFKEDKTELSTQKVELAMDFKTILKGLEKSLSSSDKQLSAMSKHAKAYIQAKNPERKGVGSSNKVSSFYKDYSKKANDLGIDVKKTMFYKEYLSALDLISQINANVDKVKAIKKSIS